VTKLVHDSAAASILEDLLKETDEKEKERLLLSVIPGRYSELRGRSEGTKDTLSSLVNCFRLSFAAVSEKTKAKTAQHFVKKNAQGGKLKHCLEICFL